MLHPKHLGFESLRKGMSKIVSGGADARQKVKVNHTLHDSVMSGFAMMYFQDRSLLQFQKNLQDQNHYNNLKTLFDVQTIPKTSQLKDILDNFDSEAFRPVFLDFFHRLQRAKHLKSFELFPNQYIFSVDGSEYFSSPTVHCPHCLLKVHNRGKANESITYSHQILQAALMHPDQKQVIPLMPEEVRNEDGMEKQDCEINACKRLIKQIRKDHPKLGIVLNGDGLYPKQPMIKAALDENMHFIFVCKPEGNKTVMEWINEQRQLGEIQRFSITDAKGTLHEFEWLNEVDLTGSVDTLTVNYFGYKMIQPQKDGTFKVTFNSSWVTDMEVDRNNVETLVKGGRCRWKIENETFNTLKNQGYHIDHSYGHGENQLSFNFFVLNLLAFYMHQIFELTDKLYQACRLKRGSKMNLWEIIRHFIRMVVFPTWHDLLQAVLNPPDLGTWTLEHGLIRPG
jgi:hypothetical protein